MFCETEWKESINLSKTPHSRPHEIMGSRNYKQQQKHEDTINFYEKKINEIMSKHKK